MTDSFIFYRSFYEAAKSLPDDQKLALYDAITSFAFDEKEVILDGVLYQLFTLIKPQLEANKVRYKNGKKGKKYGKLGGRPQKTPMGLLPETPMGLFKKTPNKNKNDNVNNNENDNKNADIKTFVLAELIRDGDAGENPDPKYSVPTCFVEIWERKNGKHDDTILFAKYKNFYSYWNCELEKKPDDPYKIDWKKTWLNFITRK